MTANQLAPIIEGLVGTGLRGAPDASGRQATNTWLGCMKIILRDSFLRDATDWNIVATDDAVNAATSLDASGGLVYGVLVDSIYDVADENLVVQVHDLTGTFDATTYDFGAFSADAGHAIVKVEFAADTSTPEFGTWLDPQGQILPNAVFVSADGEEGTAPTSLDVRVYVIYRDTVEVRVS